MYNKMDVLEPPEYKVYAMRGCPYCIKALNLLKKKKKNYSVYYLDGKKYHDFKKKYGQEATVPRIYKNGNLLGGSEELESQL